MSDTLDFSQPIVEHQYAQEWDAYKLRGLILLFLFLGYFPFGFLINLLFDVLLGAMEALGVIAAAGWMIAIGIAAWRYENFCCPRCGERFSSQRVFAFVRFSHPYSRQCIHCGLKKWEGE